MNSEANSLAADDRAAITAVVQSQAAAWNRGDAETFAERYSENGSFTNIVGVQIYGKAGFVEQHAQIFHTIFAGSHITLSLQGIHFLRTDVAVVDIDAALIDVQQLPPGARLANDGALHTKLQEVMTREGGGWWIAAFHNVAVAGMLPRSLA